MPVHKAGYTTQGRSKKILPVAKRRCGDFFSDACIPLRGAKRLLRQRGSEHLIPAYTLTIAQEHSVEAGTHRTESETGTMEKRRDGTLYCAETIKPRRIKKSHNKAGL